MGVEKFKLKHFSGSLEKPKIKFKQFWDFQVANKLCGQK